METKTFKIKAKLTLYSTEKGGRKTGIRTGYRPNHVFEYEKGKFKQTYIGQINFDEPEWILPGETHNVNVEFINMLDLKKFITFGRKWWIHEADNLLGEAEITEILE
jgi:translation elongation factor EF-Tu-like GTPase